MCESNIKHIACNRKLHNYVIDNIGSIRRPHYKSNDTQVNIISVASYGKKACCVSQSSLRPSSLLWHASSLLKYDLTLTFL